MWGMMRSQKSGQETKNPKQRTPSSPSAVLCNNGKLLVVLCETNAQDYFGGIYFRFAGNLLFFRLTKLLIRHLTTATRNNLWGYR